MAAKPAAAARVAAAPDPGAWRAFHLFYHEDRDRLLAELVAPTVAALREEGEITTFYFVRYNLGGPHVRLRVKPAAGAADRVSARVREQAEAFFARSPSTRSVPEEAILRQNQGIVATDPTPGGQAEDVFPDNSVREVPAFFEVERYGGPGLLGHSLRYFALSSREALRFVAGRAERTAGQRLAEAFRLCVQQGWAFAADGEEFVDLMGYAWRLFPHEVLARFVDRGDETFERGREGYCRLLRGELDGLARGTGVTELARGARRLAREVGRAGDDMRRFIARSQLHMTANRLGLLNPEELYLGRIVWRAAQEEAAADPAAWRRAWSRRRRPRAAQPTA